ncbi:MAG: hypothetical protein ACXAE3_00635 [Candidatus Kariarchaeaceae archaeon]|jgi:hypothetical protein
MDQQGPRVLITTSNNPSEQARRFAKVLNHILPGSRLVNRGNQSISALHQRALEEIYDYIYIIHSKHNRVDRLIVLKTYLDKLLPEGKILKINQFIDHKVLGFHKLPEKGPLSTSLEVRQLNPELMDYLETYFGVIYGEKLPLWLAVDPSEHRHTAYVVMIDAMTQKKFFYAELQLLNEGYHEHYLN